MVWLCSSVEYTELVSDKTASQFKWRMTTTSRNTSTLLQCVMVRVPDVCRGAFANIHLHGKAKRASVTQLCWRR